MKKDENKEKEIRDKEKPDLKHDTMEFSAASDGDDQLDADDPAYEEEEISAEELDSLQDDEPAYQAAALNTEEIDRLVDDDNLPEEDWTEDLPGDINDPEDDLER